MASPLGSTPTPTLREMVIVCIFLLLLVFISPASDSNPSTLLPPLRSKATYSKETFTPPGLESVNGEPATKLRETTFIKHAPGWTILDSLYMHNGTCYVVTSNPSNNPPQTEYDPLKSPFRNLPPPRALFSKGLDIFGARGGMGGDPDRVPDEYDLRYVSVQEFQTLFGIDVEEEDNADERVHVVPGLTFMLTDSPQFITHYYHFCAELWFGIWRTYASLGGGRNLPPPTRVLFPHLDSSYWRDYADMNQLFMRSVFPSTQMFFSHDWLDWVALSLVKSKSKPRGGVIGIKEGKPILFPRVLIADRSAAMPAFNYQRFQRTAAVPFGLPIPQDREQGDWWAPVRSIVRAFAGLDDETAFGLPAENETASQLQSQRTDPGYSLVHGLPTPPKHRLTVQDLIQPTVDEEFTTWMAPPSSPPPPETLTEDFQILSDLFLTPLKHQRNSTEGGADALTALAASLTRQRATRPVVTYLSRQDWNRRKLRNEDHERLVAELRKLEQELGLELIVVSAEKLTRWEQIRLVGRSTVLIGVHGNGLTSELWMNLGTRSTVIEIFFPGGWAHDYEYTARAMGGLRHFGIWNDKVVSAPDFPPPTYPEGFQGNEIPVDGRTVAELVKNRIGAAGEVDEG
ncbi:hypothetical protein D9757_001020 [Collybiopsis confluens]|uniref:Glycosyltransferase 61 catalytic domain-containing protein n=1 Tax=Collybiopsis confluens TaxID=2823264 RepID=A0A8H5I077_9AGAR|nr:hypothetical protein D9757_001020 [Collybiopsis confluens]